MVWLSLWIFPRAIRKGRGRRFQEGKGETVTIRFGSHHATCPVRALKKRLEDSGVGMDGGPCFEPSTAMGESRKKACTRTRLKPS